MIPASRKRQLSRQAEDYAGNLRKIEDYLLSRSISYEAAEMFGLGYVLDGQFSGRLAVPYYTPAGVVALKYRCTEPHDCKTTGCTKYLYEAGCGTHLYNAQALIRADRAVLTEGELDAVCVQAYTGIPAVAYPGATTWQSQRHWPLCFEGLSEVVVIADGDGTGRKAAEQVAKTIGLHARVVDLGDGHDSNSYLAAKGAASFLERISE